MSRFVLLLLAAYSIAFAQDFAVTSGLTSHRVLQRNAATRISGTAPDGPVTVRVVVDEKTASPWKQVAVASGGTFAGELSGLHAGGPYKFELRSGSSTLTFDDILVGDLWILAGQSNMEGVGDLVNVEQPDPMVHTFDMLDHWGIAKEPLHNLPGAVDRVHWRKNGAGQPERYVGAALDKFNADRKKGAGLGLPFAVEMARRTGIPIGLVPCAHGGTSMDQWDPSLKDKGGDSLYGAMLRRFREVGEHVTGVLWYQGESDANPQAAPVFQAKFERFVAAVRSDFGQPDLPFYYVQIGRHVNGSNVSEWNAVQEAQRLAERRVPNSAMIPSVDSTLDDGIHVSTSDQKRLGRRFAVIAMHDLFPNIADYGQTKRGPRPVSAQFAGGVVTVTFDEVNGKLQATGRISGFTIHDAKGDAQPLIYKAQFDPAHPSVVRLHIGGKLPEGATLRYGAGKDPYCNLTDSLDMGVPVFGPLPIAQ